MEMRWLSNIWLEPTTQAKGCGNSTSIILKLQSLALGQWCYSLYSITVWSKETTMSITIIDPERMCTWLKLNFRETHRKYKTFDDIHFSLPWNQSTYLGYFAEILFHSITSYGYGISIGTPLLLFISLCFHHQAFSKMFKHSIDESEKYDAKLLCDFIRFHISAKK